MIIYDIETFPNVFTFQVIWTETGQEGIFEISDRCDDRQPLLAWFRYWQANKTYMVGFNNEGFDYPVIHFLMMNPTATVAQLYQKAMSIIEGNDRFGHMVWAKDRFAPQVDLFKIHHFDNLAKSTSLKALQFAMRSQSVEDMPVQVGTHLNPHQIADLLIPYGMHDVRETWQFAKHSRSAIDFRTKLISQFGDGVLCWNDTKIGEKMLETRLGEDACYYRRNEDGKRVKRQTYRSKIALADIIFPYVSFANPEFQRVLAFMRAQTLTSDEVPDENGNVKIKTKGVLTGLTAQVGELTFHFGTGGVHASVDRRRYVATDAWLIRDIDVEGLYPNVAIANRLAPEHLGERFIAEYAEIPKERKKHAKGTSENAAFKLAANGAWGKSNSPHSVFYDPKYAMTIPINGQLLICMLVERLVNVPTLQLIQANTDGVTYTIHRDHEPAAVAICKAWEAFTLLKLEDVSYSRMWIRDVNNYVAETLDGKVKLKGAYEHPKTGDYHKSISLMSPTGWHKDWSALAVTRAVVEAVLTDNDPEVFIRCNDDPFDFMLRAKANKGSQLWIGDKQMQKTTRYFMSVFGQPMSKVSPPPRGMQEGWPKKASGVTDQRYHTAMQANGYKWDESVCTKNKSVYGYSRTALQSGWKVAECNDARNFDWSALDYDWYIAEAQKLMV